MGPVLPGGMSLTVKRVPFGGGAVPSRRAPMSSTPFPIEMSAGVASVHQINVDCPPDLERLRFAAGASIKTVAVLSGRCPVTILRIGGKLSFAIAVLHRDHGPNGVSYLHALKRHRVTH